tara:strand:- start:115 stop:303 length:189 start_codon:yes stop_codon:yes gene_type:complete
MKWHSRDKKLKRRRREKDISKPFRKEKSKDTLSEKKLSKYFKKVRQAEQRAEEDDQDNDELY